MKILIVDDSASARLFFRSELESIPEAEILDAASGESGIEKTLEFSPDVIVLDMELGDMDGVEVITELRHRPPFDRIPIIVITSGTKPEIKNRAFDAGASEFMLKPFPEGRLRGYVEDLMESRKTLDGRSVLIVDDSESALSLVKRILEKEGARVFCAGDGKAALKILENEKVELLITDYLMPRMNGIEVCEYVRKVMECSDIPIIMLTIVEDNSVVLESLKAGADDYLLKPFSREELLIRVHNHFRLLHSYQEKQEAQTQLLQASQLASLGSFARTFSTELSEYLRLILGASESIEDSLLDAPESDEIQALYTLQGAAKNAEQVIKHLKTFARDSSKQERVQGDLNTYLQEAFTLFTGRMEKEKIISNPEWGRGLAEIHCDFPQIEQAFSNLILNACEAMRDSVKKELKVRTFEEAEELVIEVEDSGHGITQQNRPKIFDPFFTTKPDVRGSGMGLAVCYGIVEDHGGTLSLVRSSGKGSLFRMTLPKGIWLL